MIIYLIITAILVIATVTAVLTQDDDLQTAMSVVAIIFGIVWVIMSIALLAAVGTIPQTVNELNAQKLEIEMALEEGTNNSVRDAREFNMKLNSTHDFHENPFISWFNPDYTKYVSPIIIPSD